MCLLCTPFSMLVINALWTVLVASMAAVTFFSLFVSAPAQVHSIFSQCIHSSPVSSQRLFAMTCIALEALHVVLTK